MNSSILAKKIKDTDLFIFDLDGTLIDSKKDLIRAVQHGATAIGHPETPVERIESYLAAGSMSLIREVLGSDERFEEAFEHFSNYYEAHLLDETKPYEGVVAILDKLRGKSLAVMSNKREKFCLATLRGLNLDHYFKMIVGGDTRPHKKPHPDPLLFIAAKLGIEPRRTMMIGDSPQDVEAAKGAGMFSVAVYGGFTSRERIDRTEADAFLNDINDLNSYL